MIGYGARASARYASGSVPLAGAFTTQATDTSNATAYTYTAQSVGAEAADRRVVIVATARGTAGATSCSITVGGDTATQDMFDGFAGTGNAVCIAHIDVPTGITKTVVVTWDATQQRCAISVYRITGGDLAVTDTAIARDFSTTPTDLVLSPTVTDGFVIAAFLGVAATDTVTFAGATEDCDVQVGGEGQRHATASVAATAATDTVTVTAATTASNLAAAIAYEGA